MHEHREVSRTLKVVDTVNYEHRAVLERCGMLALAKLNENKVGSNDLHARSLSNGASLSFAINHRSCTLRIAVNVKLELALSKIRSRSPRSWQPSLLLDRLLQQMT